MDSYEVRCKQSAERDLRRIDGQQIAQIIRVIECLSNDHFPSKHRKLRGTEKLYRIRVGEYSILRHTGEYEGDPKEKMSNLKMRLRNYDLYDGIKRHYASI